MDFHKIVLLDHSASFFSLNTDSLKAYFELDCESNTFLKKDFLIVSSDANLFTFSAAKWRGVIPNLFLALTLAEFWIRISAQPSDLNQIYSISQNDHHLHKVSTLRISQYVKQTLFSPNIIWPNIIWLDIILAKKTSWPTIN